MALTHLSLGDIQYVPSSAGALYTNPSLRKTYVRGVVLFNGNTTTEIVKLYLVPNSAGSLGTAGVSNQFIEISLISKETVNYELPGPGFVLTGTNDSVQGVTTTASKVTVVFVGDYE